jgi:hypothetical protein
LIFNDLWKGICEALAVPDRIIKEEEESYFEYYTFESKSKSSRPGSTPSIPKSNKECDIWEEKHQKAYVVISMTVSEEVSHHIASIKNSYSSLNILNDLYDTHSELELIQLMVKLLSGPYPRSIRSLDKTLMK